MIELGHIINSIKCRQRDNVAFTDCSYENISNKFHIQGVPELADQIETVYSLMVMKVKNV
jgi:hypothetical protein